MLSNISTLCLKLFFKSWEPAILLIFLYIAARTYRRLRTFPLFLSAVFQGKVPLAIRLGGAETSMVSTDHLHGLLNAPLIESRDRVVRKAYGFANRVTRSIKLSFHIIS